MNRADRPDAGDHDVDEVVDVVVVGGGLAGLAAAATAARAGARVVVVEARTTAGGRARSDQVAGHTVNHGAHALYRTGAGASVLRRSGVVVTGSRPSQRGLGWWVDGCRVPARRPAAVGGRHAVSAVRALLSGVRGGPAPGEVDLATWLDTHVADQGRPLAETLIRTATYSADLSCLDAAAGLAQLRRGAAGVLYLDGGWVTIVDGLRRAALDAGAAVVADRVDAIRPRGDGYEVVRRTGAALSAPAVVVAVGGPTAVDHLLEGRAASVAGHGADVRPVVAACLDVVVGPAPDRRPVATYGVGLPVYLVDHAASARLAPDGGSTLHGLFYEPDLHPDLDHRAVLEQVLDAQDPGWRDRVRHVAYRRRLVVAHDRPRPARLGGPVASVRVPELDGLFVAGDWLTGHGMLADASLASGEEAGELATARARSASGKRSPVGTVS